MVVNFPGKSFNPLIDFQQFGTRTAVARAPFRDLLRRAPTLATTRNPSGVVRPRARMLARVIGAARKRRVTRTRRSKVRQPSHRSGTWIICEPCAAVARTHFHDLVRRALPLASPRHPMREVPQSTQMIADAVGAAPKRRATLTWRIKWRARVASVRHLVNFELHLRIGPIAKGRLMRFLFLNFQNKFTHGIFSNFRSNKIMLANISLLIP